MTPVPVRFRRLARRDLNQIIAFYESQQIGLGTRFVRALDDQMALLAEFPEMHPAELHGLRKTQVKRFPILVYYKLEGELIIVLALIHGARDQQLALEGR